MPESPSAHAPSLAVSAEMVFLYFDFILHITCDIDESHRFLLGSAVRSGDAGPQPILSIRIRRPNTPPAAISRAVCSLTAPYFFRVALLTPRIFFFALLEYVTYPSLKTSEAPARWRCVRRSDPPGRTLRLSRSGRISLRGGQRHPQILILASVV